MCVLVSGTNGRQEKSSVTERITVNRARECPVRKTVIKEHYGKTDSFTLCVVTADGNCFFTTLRAIVQTQLSAVEVRKMVVNFYPVAEGSRIFTLKEIHHKDSDALR